MEYSSTIGINIHEYTVSELNKAIQGTLEGKFENIRVRGEISGLNKAASGHVYLSLKDNDSIISAVIWSSKINQFNFIPEDGMEVLVDGNIKTWAPASKYQIIINNVELAGEGALLKLVEDRKRKLQQEGLFDVSFKNKLPYIPNCIGIITSETGAAFRDILKILRDRFPISILLYPVLVQGKGAAEEISNAIKKINEIDKNYKYFKKVNFSYPDLLIVGRGGGSLEDLMAFNEEILVRAIFDSKIPIISAVGHEIDNTLADLVADARAPTPTAAAEMAVPEKMVLLNDISNLDNRLLNVVKKHILMIKDKLKALSISPPYMLFENKSFGVTDKFNKIQINILKLIKNLENKLQKRPIFISDIINKINNENIKLNSIYKYILINIKGIRSKKELSTLNIPKDFEKKIISNLNIKRMSLHVIAGKLESLSYENVLNRGFAMIEDRNNKLIKSITELKENSEINIQLRDGKVRAEVKK